MTTSVVSRLGRAPEEGIKAPCKAATTAPITLNGTGQTIDGYLTSTGDRILVKDQLLPAENGIYLVGQNDWQRSSDMNADNDVENGQFVADANRGILYEIQVTKPWNPSASPINFVPGLASMPPSITLTNNSPIDLVDVDVALKTGAADPATEQHLEFDFQAIQSKSDAATAAPMFLQPQGSYVQMNQSISGDPGFEADSINVNGFTFTSSDKVSDIGGVNVTQFILHRHSDTWGPSILGARTQGNTASHVLVLDNDALFSIYGCGWEGTYYAIGATIEARVDGAPGPASMPARWEFSTTASGDINQTLRMVLDSLGNLTLTNAGIPQEFRFEDTSAAALDGKWNILFDGTELSFNAVDDSWGVTAEYLYLQRDSGNGLISSMGVGSTEVEVVDITASAEINLDAGGITHKFEATQVTLNQWLLGTDQVLGAPEDQYIATYDHGTGEVIFLPAPSGGNIGGSIANNQIAVGAVTANDIEGDGNLTWDGDTMVIQSPSAGTNALSLFNFGVGGITLDASATSGADTIAIRAFSAIANRTVPVLFVENDSSTGSGVAAEIQQDQSAPHLDLTGVNGEGIRFTSNQISSDVNTLDWYEEGTMDVLFDDNPFGDGVSQGQTYGFNNRGSYTRIGRIVFYSVRMEVTSIGSVSGNALVVFNGTLPNNTAEAINYPAAVADYSSLNKGADHSVSAYYFGINGCIALSVESNNGSDPQMTAAQFSDGGEVYITGWYEVNGA